MSVKQAINAANNFTIPNTKQFTLYAAHVTAIFDTDSSAFESTKY
jgi:hypothetical protein